MASSIVVAKKRSRIDYCSNEFNSILPPFLFPTLVTMATNTNTNTNTGQHKRIRNNENLHHSSELPQEILLEIMFYLNAKDLQNYKSVSKFWYSSISTPDFINTHLTLIKQTPSEQEIILTTLQIPKNQTSIHEYTHFSITNIQNNNTQKKKQLIIITPKNLNLPFHINHKNIALSLQATCDGLLLFQDKYNPKQLYVSNPVTSHFDPLPPIPLYCVTWALVRDTRIHKYKVFGVNAILQCTVFILGEKTPKWDTCTVPSPTKMNDCVFSQLFLRRKELHWLTTDVYVNNAPLNSSQECYCLYSVNIQTYGFIRSRIPPQLIRLSCPDQISATKGLHLLSEVNRSLCVTIVSTLQLEMFLLKDRLNSIWTKSLTVRLHSLSNQPSFFHSFLSDDICLIPTKGVNGADLLDLVKVYIHRGDQLFMYDLKTQECSKLGFLSKDQKLCSRYFFNSDSLVSWTSLSGGI